MVRTKKECVVIFHDLFLPAIRERFERGGRPDYTARVEQWNEWIDSLIMDGLLHTRAKSWSCPFVRD